jgi:altronate dehydratase
MSVLEPTGPLLRLHPEEPVAIARRDLAAGESLAGGEPLAGGERPLLALEPIPSGHKVALRTLEAGQVVHKYGQAIGATTRRVVAGEHVHDHNLISPSRRSALPFAGGAAPRPDGAASPPGSPAPRAEAASAVIPAPPPRTGTMPTFAGLLRPDGRVGTRNYVAVLSTVNCSATVVRRIASAFSAPGALDEHPGVDGVIAITHGEEKSLGAVAKGGSSPLTAVYRYAEPVTEPGLVFMDTPGYAPVSVTGIAGRRRHPGLLHHRPRVGVRM